MTRRAFAASLTAAPLAAQSRRPNIVFILADDHRYDILGCLGHPWIKTPHLDALAASGVLFENAFVTSSLCSPSRASILTGQYMHTHLVRDNFSPLPASLPTFPALLQKAGYRTGFLGKWHMGGDSDAPRPGFHEWFSFEGQGVYYDGDCNSNGRRVKTKGYITDVLTEQAERFIAREAKSGSPFCLYFSHKAVHSPFEPAPRHKDLYANERMPRPETLWARDEWYEQWPEWVKRRRATRHGVDGGIGQMAPLEDLYKAYCRSLAAIDDSVGRVRAALAQAGALENTLIVYLGDNGYLWGEHGLIDKRAMYEPSIRVPMIAHCPALFGPSRKKEFALNIDIAPTFLELAGVAAPKMAGRSLLPLLTGRATNWRRDFLYEYEWERDFPYTPTIHGLRTERYSLMQYYGLWDLDELYDLERDPQQIKNLLAPYRMRSLERGRTAMRITDPAMKQLVDSLQARMAQLLEETGGDPRYAGREIPGAKAAL